jgi:hypothetical protein
MNCPKFGRSQRGDWLVREDPKKVFHDRVRGGAELKKGRQGLARVEMMSCGLVIIFLHLEYLLVVKVHQWAVVDQTMLVEEPHLVANDFHVIDVMSGDQDRTRVFPGNDILAN